MTKMIICDKWKVSIAFEIYNLATLYSLKVFRQSPARALTRSSNPSGEWTAFRVSTLSSAHKVSNLLEISIVHCRVDMPEKLSGSLLPLIPCTSLRTLCSSCTNYNPLRLFISRLPSSYSTSIFETMTTNSHSLPRVFERTLANKSSAIPTSLCEVFAVCQR